MNETLHNLAILAICVYAVAVFFFATFFAHLGPWQFAFAVVPLWAAITWLVG